MEENEQQEREAVYEQIYDAIQSSVSSFPGAELISAEGIQSFLSGISPAKAKKGIAGIVIRSDKTGLVLDVSVAVASVNCILQTGQALQSAIWKSVQDIDIPVNSVNIDILRIKK